MSAKERQLQVDYSRDIAPLQQVRDAALSRRASEFYERALADSKEALLSALDITDVIVYLKDPAGRYILMSPWYEEQFHNNKRFEGKTDYDFFPKKRADEFRKNDEMAVKAGKLMEFHEVLVHQNREDRAISFKFPIFDHEGTLCGVCGFATPLVTDRNQAKKARKKSEDFYSAIFNAIRESEVRYQTLFESANDAVCLIKGDFFIDCNRKALEIFGCQRRDIIAKPFLRFSPLKQPNGEDSHTEVGKKISAAKQGIEQRFEWRCCRNDGTEFDSEVILNKVEVLGKKYIQAVIRDVTERKHAKEKKRQMLKTLRAFMDNSPAFIYVKDKECKYIDVNRRIMELFAVPKEAFVGKSDYDFFQKGVADIFYASDLRVLKGEAVEYEVVVEFSNRKVVFIDNKFPLKDERGKPYAICGIATNITEMKEAEKSVKESEERYRTLANHVADGVMLVQHRLLTFVNDALVTMMNCENRESLVGAAAADFFAEEDRDRFLTMCDSLISGLTTKEVLEAQCVIKDAKKFWTEGHYRTISWQGQPAVLGTVRDITDFKLREQAMQEETAHVRNELVKLKSSLKDRYRMGNIIGKSQAMQQVYEQILQAASSEANVVILGESGTGKELVARAIHAMSGRADHDFIPVNCGAIPENLVESEFFGHRKGAFTSAHAERKGYFDAAKEGTLFLDEVGELGLSMQVKLLRAVESGEYTMLGDTTPQKASVRIIAATSRNLREMVKRGIMREDFYYRISVISVVLPALRDRRDDIPLLVFHFIEHYARGKKVHVPGKIMEALYRYDWPGNIRELQNVIQRFLTVGKLGLEDSITKPHEGRTTIPLPEEIRSLETATDEFERCYIRKVLEENRWSKAKTAAALQIDPKTLYRKMKRVGLI